jgi:hypothetical protein
MIRASGGLLKYSAFAERQQLWDNSFKSFVDMNLFEAVVVHLARETTIDHFGKIES